MQPSNPVLEKALRILSFRAHSYAELFQKLSKAGFEEEAICPVLQKLLDNRLLDDAAFAAAWVSARAAKGMGPRRIAQELRQKGVSPSLYVPLLDVLAEEALLESAVALAEKHLLRSTKNAQKRTFDALIRRGFSFETAKAALRIADANTASDGEEI